MSQWTGRGGECGNCISMEGGELEWAKRRCERVIQRISKLVNINDSCYQTLLKLALSELNFLSTLDSYSFAAAVLSTNIGHLESVVYILEQPFITGVSRVCKPNPNPLAENSSSSKGVHVDLVCTLNGSPVWIMVSDRNPKHVSWHGSHKDKGLKWRIQQLLSSAAQFSHTFKPYSLILFFSRGLASSILETLQSHFGASYIALDFTGFNFDFHEDVKGDWVQVLGKAYGEACVLEIRLREIDLGKESLVVTDGLEFKEAVTLRDLGGSFSSLFSGMKNIRLHNGINVVREGGLVNFDTTSVIAIASGISNGCADKLLAVPENQLRERFKGNTEFVMLQAKSEIEYPIHLELQSLISGMGGIICESVVSECKELVSICGGPNEKLRANYLLQQLMVVRDNPSERIIGLPTTRKLALKNKIVFGTADYWRSPTLTANAAFVRAISQTGMSLYTIVHRPRALIGD